jgi:lipid-A-disaccharide synthase
LLDAIGKMNAEKSDNWKSKNEIGNHSVIAILPGSRKQEISTMLPIMLSVVDEFPEFRFVIGGAPSVDAAFYNTFVEGKDVKIVYGQTYDLLRNATAAMVTSGTATLETALFNVPEVVCYKGNFISYHIARQLVKVKYISLVNLIMDREVVKELIQDELNRENLVRELKSIAVKGSRQQQILDDYNLLKDKLGGIGASARAAKLIFSSL